MNYQQKLQAIREQMNDKGISAYIIPSADPHISEYLPEFYKCIQFASGFTGSAGTLVITPTTAALWTDFRYFVQAEEQLKDTGYELVKLKIQHSPEYIAWLAEVLDEYSVVAFNDRLLSIFLAELLEAELAEKKIVFKSYDLLDSIWSNRPALPNLPAFCLDAKFTGQTVAEKLFALRRAMKSLKTDQHIISSLDDIAWLFNVRGNDVSYNPVVLSFAIINEREAILFIQPEKLTQADTASLKIEGVTIKPYDDIAGALSELPQNSKVLLDPKRNCFGLYHMLPKTASIVRDVNPTTHFKSIKNATEINSIRSAMIKDGVAMTRFFMWMEANIGKIRITELSASEKLKEFRAEQATFAGVSFNTIGGYKAHGALPHYMATAESDSEILNEGLFLVDSGGQYFYGTTDITRMIPLGEPTEEERIDYTLVLKAMIEGSKAIYPKGTCGYQIDAICRRPLWEHGINYGHGTGHGVGFYLNVHEGPQVINPTNVAIPMQIGMVTSIEPGIYRPGKHGVRIENLVLTVAHSTTEFAEFYGFETLTLATIDTRLIKKELLENSQIKWLNDYHQIVFEKLSPELNAEEQDWLKQKTRSLN